MTIHDELILALTQKDEKRIVPLYRIVRSTAIKYELESSTYLPAQDKPDYTAPAPPEGIAPDIVIKFEHEKSEVAIEVETDMDFDFGKSLRQIKKYQRRFRKVYVIIPKEYERFVPLYKNEDFDVYLWTATRIWECMQCGNIIYEKRPITPKCSKRSCGPHQRLKGIMDTTFIEA